MKIAAHLFGIAFAIALPAKAETPACPLRIVVPFAAGGPADSVVRIISAPLAERLGRPVVVENKTGADGVLAGQAVAAARPDGCTLLYAVSATAALPVVTRTTYDMTRDFTPVTTIGAYDFGMFVSTRVPAQSVAQFVSFAKANPGKVNFATLNLGEHHAVALFMRAAGIDMTKVPYRSMAQILPDMVAGQVHLYFGPLANAGLARDGRVRLLAMLGAERSAMAPEVPTMSEAGLPEVTYESVQMLFAPAKTPREVVEKLSREVNAVLLDPESRARLEKLTLRVRGGSPDAMRKEQEAANVAWARFARENHLSTQ